MPGNYEGPGLPDRSPPTTTTGPRVPSPDTAFGRVCDALRDAGRKVVPRGLDQALAQCPVPGHAHDDRNPSLSLTRVPGSVLITCRSRGHDYFEVMAALGLPENDGFDNQRDKTWTYSDGRRSVKRYDWGRKKFEQPGINHRTPAPYTMPEPSEQLRVIRDAVAAGEPILLVEGEKDVDAIMSRWPEVVAVTAPQGANSFHLVDVEPLRGAQVLAVVDKDNPREQDWTPQVLDKLGPVAGSLDFVQAKEGKDA